jgi:SAM-dependent methyltransferase
MADNADSWFADWFDRDYLRVYKKRDVSDARDGVALFEASLKPTGGRMLDLGCGAGRHLALLRDAGHDAVGLDLSPHLLAEAGRTEAGRAEAGRATRGGLPLVRGDMRSLPFAAGTFETIGMFFTTFGYFGDDENRPLLDEIRRVLQPGGRLYLDLLNRQHVLQSLVPEGRRQLDDGTEVHERRWWDADGQRLKKEVTLTTSAGDERRITESVRLYFLEELTALCRDQNLDAEARFGDLHGKPYDERSSPRMILRVTRRET